MAIGIMGGFSGRYRRLDFHEKTRDYELLDDRDLWLLELKVSRDQRYALDAELKRVEGQWFPYTFFERNCAYYLQMVLAAALQEIPIPSGPTSPTEVFAQVVRTSLAGKTYFRAAASRRLEESARTLSTSAFRRLQETEWDEIAEDLTWLESLRTGERRLVQEYLAWKALKHADLLSTRAIEGIAWLRVIDVRDGVTDAPNRPYAPGVPIKTPAFHRYARASLFYTNGSGERRLAFRFRPALHDEFDRWTAHRPINTFEFLTVEVSAALSADQTSLQLEKLILFAQRSLNPSSWVAKRRSWLLEAAMTRGGVLGKGLQGGVRAGTGLTEQIGAGVVLYGLFTAAGRGDTHKATLAPGIDAGFLVLPHERWRLGARWSWEADLFRGLESYYNLGVWTRYDINAEVAVRLSGFLTDRANPYSIGVDWYP